jgi:diguanylate cyclase (GGDEF)-like protein/PAS domain S-box-containing protein
MRRNKYYRSGVCQLEQIGQTRSVTRVMVSEFLKIIFPLALISALVVVAFQIQSYRYELDDLRALGEASVQASSESIHKDFVDASADLRVLAASTSLREVLDSGGPQAIESTARDFLAFIAFKKKYDQVRYIDAQGMEVIRVNYRAGAPLIVPAQKLQNKGDRYYFRDTLSLSRDQVFVSPLDLNIENGVIEQPRKPMIRFGMPLFDSSGVKKGALVINYLGDHFLDHLRTIETAQGNRTMLLNGEGYWLLAPDPEDEWGFMFDNGRRFQSRYPSAWRTFQQSPAGVYQDGEGIFAYTTIHPMKQGHVSSTGSAEAYAPSAAMLRGKEYSWVLTSHVPMQVIEAKKMRRWVVGLLQYGVLLLILVPLTLAFSWAHVRRRAADDMVARLEQRMRDITQSLAVGLFVLDKRGRLSMINPEGERLLGWSEEELCGEEIHDLIYQAAEQEAPDSNVFLKRADHSDDGLFQRKDGSSFHVSYVVSPLMIDRQSVGNVVSFQDISERKQMEQELERMATRDDLTGLHNRRELNRRLEDELRRAERYEQQFSVWMLDIDHFKAINDTFGHPVGDKVLETLAINLVRILRDTDIIARYGGEEFTVILPHTSLEQSKKMAERVCTAVAAMTFDLNGSDDLSTTVSIGVAAYPRHGTTADQLIHAADQGLYAAKQSGRNRVCVEAES